MKKAYIYPDVLFHENPYLRDFVDSLSKEFNFVNLKHPNCFGILSAFKYLKKVDIMFFNWVEDLPDKRAGYLQTLAFLYLIRKIKKHNIKLFYTLHNKQSHFPTNERLKNLLLNKLLQNANNILCHSSAGVEVLKERNISQEKFRYFPHPFNAERIRKKKKPKEYDILIWGAINPYKGIDLYLKYLDSQGLLGKYKTKIAGKAHPPEYLQELIKFKSESIDIQNEFMSDSQLNNLIDKSRIVLFTYNESSVLSSGALIYTLGRGANVIGPDTAAFSDLEKEGLLRTFVNYQDLIIKVDDVLRNPFDAEERINRYMAENNWKIIGNRICCWITAN